MLHSTVIYYYSNQFYPQEMQVVTKLRQFELTSKCRFPEMPRHSIRRETIPRKTAVH